MREVAVTEGDKVAAQIQFGYAVNGYGMGDLVEAIADAGESDVDELVKEYDERYTVAPKLRKGGAKRDSLREAARIELGLRGFSDGGGGAGVHGHVRGFAWGGAIAGIAGAAADGGGVRFRGGR